MTATIKNDSSFDGVWAWILSSGLAIYLIEKFWKSRDDRGQELRTLEKRVTKLEDKFETLPLVIKDIIHEELRGVKEEMKKEMRSDHEHLLRNIKSMNSMMCDILDDTHKNIMKDGEKYLQLIKNKL